MFYKDVGIWVALGHGILSFFSPCVLPLIPAFLGILFTAKNKFFKLFGFFLGFSIFFTIIGIFSSLFGLFFAKYGSIINYVLGFIIIVMGILYILQKEFFKPRRVNVWKFKGGGFLTGFLLGGGIGIIWIPCSSPILASILSIAASVSSTKGAILLFVYSLGISIPFLTIGASVSKILTMEFKSTKWEIFLRVVGGVFLILLGILIIMGKMVV
ncbi:cytochrome C biogenesis protein [Thermosipho melanesiensis]|uniref:Cytochrome c biogenesis protein, transmembrane region n=1 Tax=Thermosipho melanesiensis (strain DSM 12029 / CIP 104789 / BI429) TaxID=391009 RepID=A6LKG6_THEM4|nr:cytochrome c biogenesis CcdA family protein [Thermosipho melanesiensis]ABR30417.1 cytochrome c biogenesis protein, transmembrane region [Thermosipho melanesiensis BI429]OOC37525.1 cytochrome C biogenesis protein [Thermosipho melanesiensis]OOC39421.1 cytochrome C biogenesis protein [Thermosipho melanesiensis]OOC39484.1 cytochrome C biogenesis protein [Thermosipho melanesiensis]OOC42557.1 cytochrome C biogenesis protein [Thermosipho melanesiensis]